MSKSLANRLKSVLPKIISKEQIGLVPGRSILDEISIIQEMMHSAQLNKESCMLIKLNMQKGFEKFD